MALHWISCTRSLFNPSAAAAAGNERIYFRHKNELFVRRSVVGRPDEDAQADTDPPAGGVHVRTTVLLKGIGAFLGFV